MLTGRLDGFGELTLSHITPPCRQLHRHRRRKRSVLITRLRVVILKGIREFIGMSRNLFNGTSSHHQSPHILRSGRTYGMHDGEDAMPLDNTHLNQRSADIWADEHHHGVVLTKCRMANRSAWSMASSLTPCR